MRCPIWGRIITGDMVTLLLGMNGDVVGADGAWTPWYTVRYGVVQSVTSNTYDDGYGKIEWTTDVATILCTDGQVYQDPVQRSSVRAGSVVEVTVAPRRNQRQKP